MDTLLAIIIVVFGILQLILFFKIWGMTNDIREIKNKYLDSSTNSQIQSSQEIEYFGSIPKDGSKFKEDDLVVLLATGKQMRVKRYTDDGKYSCYTNGGTVYQGDYAENELRLF